MQAATSRRNAAVDLLLAQNMFGQASTPQLQAGHGICIAVAASFFPHAPPSTMLLTIDNLRSWFEAPFIKARPQKGSAELKIGERARLHNSVSTTTVAESVKISMRSVNFPSLVGILGMLSSRPELSPILLLLRFAPATGFMLGRSAWLCTIHQHVWISCSCPVRKDRGR